jgi:hypothetical protein
MNPIEPRQQVLLGLLLTALMAATRGQHFAVLSYLPDASLAAFFIAGVWLRPVWAFPALYAVSALIDAVAVGWAGVSAFCITPAYALLIPAYGALWVAGRWYAGHHRLVWSALPRLAAAAVVGGALSEVFSTGGFYLFSGYFGAPSLEGVVAGVFKYLPATLTHLALYLGLAALAYLGLASNDGVRAGAATR